MMKTQNAAGRRTARGRTSKAERLRVAMARAGRWLASRTGMATLALVQTLASLLLVLRG